MLQTTNGCPESLLLQISLPASPNSSLLLSSVPRHLCFPLHIRAQWCEFHICVWLFPVPCRLQRVLEQFIQAQRRSWDINVLIVILANIRQGFRKICDGVTAWLRDSTRKSPSVRDECSDVTPESARNATIRTLDPSECDIEMAISDSTVQDTSKHVVMSTKAACSAAANEDAPAALTLLDSRINVCSAVFA